MAMRTHIAKIAVGVTLAAIAAAPAFGQPSPQQHRAVWLRAHALNAIYGLGHPTAMTHAEYRGKLLRAAALNERYGLPTLGADEIARLFGTGLHAGGAVAPSNPPPAVSPWALPVF